MRRPGTLTTTTTPLADEIRTLLGGPASYEGVSFTQEEFKQVQLVYGYAPEHTPLATELMQAGADRNAMRQAASDGLRLMGWLAKYVQTGEDSLKVLICMAACSGLDVSPEDLAWATEEIPETGNGVDPEISL